MLQLVHVEGSISWACRKVGLHGYAGIRIKINNTCLGYTESGHSGSAVGGCGVGLVGLDLGAGDSVIGE